MTIKKPHMTETEIRAEADAVVHALNEHDVDELLKHLTDDVVWIEPGYEYHGKDEVAVHQKEKFEAFPDMHLSRGAPTFSLDPPCYATTWESTGIMRGSMHGIPATGGKVAFCGTTVCTLHDGLINEYRVSYDRFELLQQMGVLPEPEGLGFKTVAAFNIMLHRDRKALHQ